MTHFSTLAPRSNGELTPTQRLTAQFGLSEYNPKPYVLLTADDGAPYVQRRPAPYAFQHCDRLQINPDNSTAVITLDCDRVGDWQREHERRFCEGAPMPTWIIAHQSTGRAHIGFVLAAPVHRNPQSSWPARAYLGAIIAHLGACFGADPGYTGLITRNPVNPGPDCSILTAGKFPNPYTLDQLAIDLPAELKARRLRPELSAHPGRNCAMFRKAEDLTRANPEPLELDAIMRLCAQINMQFETPLPYSEVRATAKSVYKRQGERLGKRARAAHNGRRSGAKRRRANADRNAEIVSARRSGRSVADLSAQFGLSERQIERIAPPPVPTSETKPWRALGISRRTWYYRKSTRPDPKP